MGLGDLIVLAKTTLYVFNFVLSFFVFIPLSVNHNQFFGNCLLNAKGKWYRNGTLQITEWGPSSACNFDIFTGVTTMLISLVSVTFMAVHLVKGSNVSWLSGFIHMLLSCAYTIFTFAAAVILTIGFQKWCDLLNENNVSCEVAQLDLLVQTNIVTSDFFSEFGMAQFGSWSVWFCWLIISILWIFKMYKLSEIEDIKISFKRERQKLLHSNSDINEI